MEPGRPRSSIEQVRNEHILDGEPAFGEALLVMVAQDCIDGGAVALYAVGPPVVTEQRAVLANQLGEPGQHHVHVVERHALHILVLHAVLGGAETPVHRPDEVRMVFGELAHHHYRVHYREDSVRW